MTELHRYSDYDYDRSMVFKVYALNLLLIPVNIAGVLKSIQQGITGGKIPFGRTPKVNDRTRSERKYIFFEYLILLGIIASAAHSSYKHEWLYFCFSLFNLISMLYAIKLIGFKESLEDLFRTPNQDIPQGNLVSSQNAVCSLVNLKNRAGSDGA